MVVSFFLASTLYSLLSVQRGGLQQHYHRILEVEVGLKREGTRSSRKCDRCTTIIPTLYWWSRGVGSLTYTTHYAAATACCNICRTICMICMICVTSLTGRCSKCRNPNMLESGIHVCVQKTQIHAHAFDLYSNINAACH